jgi:predicted aconitase
MAALCGADRLIPITSAHVDGCLYHGQVSLDFARKLVAGAGRVRVPTTLNVGSVDLLHPELFRGSLALAQAGRELMRLYEELGCRATWTCAPYQQAARPAFGEHVAWAESNAIVFVNSVLGARTDRYGDFIDICAALLGRAPYAGLHRPENRRGRVCFRVERLPARLQESDILFAALGHLIGKHTGNDVPVIIGLEHATEDQMKALGAGAASSGSVALFHIVGVTPEAPTESAAFAGRPPLRTVPVTRGDLKNAAAELTSTASTSLAAVSVGTPHFSLTEFSAMREVLADRRVADTVQVYVSTSRGVLAELESRGWAEALRACGVRILTDTCTYITPILDERPGAVMTNSAKWAWYAPANIGKQVVFGSLRECVESAVRGEVWRDDSIW